jgi:hypothetical protein
MNLPESWGLETKKRDDGKLDIVGKDDNGYDYRVRTTDQDHITQKDVDELHAADRETYANRDAGCRAFINNLTGGKKEKVPVIEQAMAFDDPEWLEAAKPVIAAGFGHKSFGSTRKYRSGVEQWLESFKGDLC